MARGSWSAIAKNLHLGDYPHLWEGLTKFLFSPLTFAPSNPRASWDGDLLTFVGPLALSPPSIPFDFSLSLIFSRLTSSSVGWVSDWTVGRGRRRDLHRPFFSLDVKVGQLPLKTNRYLTPHIRVLRYTAKRKRLGCVSSPPRQEAARTQKYAT